ncbi:hypothetical protein J5N97_006453 [Dioscorea zingiberensis]|uniref:Uncharacterized protein n=1 Tax=Dioscorea zingiberensis TaxID=325984 RepID=A0A9D5HU17_9LILI|nr:hypothetical protein J5N97_006453 [Dioscorea zingiberensis]
MQFAMFAKLVFPCKLNLQLAFFTTRKVEAYEELTGDGGPSDVKVELLSPSNDVIASSFTSASGGVFTCEYNSRSHSLIRLR